MVAEAGEWIKPRGSRLQLATIVPLHSTLDNRPRPHIKKKKELKQNSKLQVCL